MRRPRTTTGFVPPSGGDRVRALGETSNPAFAPSANFSPLRAPKTGEWLAEHREGGQTFDQYLRSPHHKPNATRKYLYITTIGSVGVNMAEFTAYVGEFFQVPVKRMAAVPVRRVKKGMRVHPAWGMTQLHAGKVLRHLKTIVPADAYAVIAVTSIDLYPKKSWNFVFGMASLQERVGVHSLARYKDKGGDTTLERRRAFKVMAHEIGHMFGMDHCIHYECLMNGSNSLEETDSSTPHLCPVCLRKLHAAVGFDPRGRYRKLSLLYTRFGLAEESNWAARRVGEISD